MSLIQDALKRKGEETPAPPETVPPVAPAQAPPAEKTPLPASNTKSEPAKPAASKLPAVLAAAVVLILLGFGVGVYLNRSQPAAKAAASEPVVQPAPTPAVKMPSSPVSAADLTKAEAPPQTEAGMQERIPEKIASNVNWPELTFSGSALGGDQILAIINGRMLSVGDKIKGAEVLQIGKTEVLVEFQGEKRILSVDDE